MNLDGQIWHPANPILLHVVLRQTRQDLQSVTVEGEVVSNRLAFFGCSIFRPTSPLAMRYHCRKLLLALGFLVLHGFLGAHRLAAQEENLSVVQDWMHYTDASNALYRHLSSQGFQHLSARAQAIAALETKRQWRQRQENVRSTLLDIVGPFPEKTPLNAQVVGSFKKEDYRVEHLVYESRPNFYVTASLFIPDGLQEPAPAILYCSGHTQEGYRSQTYQHVILNLVKKGFVVLAFDPVSQGERLQYVDAQTNTSQIGGPTDEHSYAGAQAFISGSSQARHMIWDGIRAVDYLVSRKEVDAGRIGVTGRSGGGTQSAYIAAFDERVHAAAPENYITSFQRLLESIGPQDAEQNFYHGLARGIDHADLLEVRAPKPALMITTTRDFFSIQGARETYREVKGAYEAFGKPENIKMVEDDAGHASTQNNREALYAFFQKHLNLPGRAEDEEVEYLSPKELQVTETGQVATSLGGETIFSLNRAETQQLIGKLEQSRKDLPRHLSSVKRAARKLSGYVDPPETTEAIFAGRYQRDGYAVEKYAVQGEGEYVIPLLLMVPDKGRKHPAVVYLHPEGKAAEADPGEAMEWWVMQGYVVLAPDLIGIGEMGEGAFKGDSNIEGVSYNKWLGSVLVGRSIAGIQAGDLVRAVNFLKGRSEVEPGAIAAVAYEEMAPVLLHAAAFEQDLSKVALVRPLISYRSLVTSKYYDPAFVPSTVAGAMTAYDLPDLAASVAPRELLIVNALNGEGKEAGAGLLEQELAVVRSAYAKAGTENHLKVRKQEPGQVRKDVFSSWIE